MEAIAMTPVATTKMARPDDRPRMFLSTPFRAVTG